MISGQGYLGGGQPSVVVPNSHGGGRGTGTNLLHRCLGRRSRYTPAQSYSRQAERAAYLSSAADPPKKANRETLSGTRVTRLNQVQVSAASKSEHGSQWQRRRAGLEVKRGNTPRTRTFFSGNRFPLATEPSIDVHRFFCSPRSSPAEVEV